MRGWCDNTVAAATLATELYKKQKSLGLLRAYSTRSQRQPLQPLSSRPEKYSRAPLVQREPFRTSPATMPHA